MAVLVIFIKFLIIFMSEKSTCVLANNFYAVYEEQY